MSAFRLTRRANGDGAPTNGGVTTRKGTSTAKKPGEAELDRMIQEAEYEVEQDPYRGIFTASGPWRQCAFGSIQQQQQQQQGDNDDNSVEEIRNSNNDDEQDTGMLVQMVTQSTCPCLEEWTDEARAAAKKKKGGRKKKNAATQQHAIQFGARPDDPTFRCRCDYNPFCLGTLGGVMNDMLADHFQALGSDGVAPGTPTAAKNDDDDDVVVLDDNGTDSGTVYSPKTAEQLKLVRQSVMVSVEPIRKYLERTLQDLTLTMSVEACLQSLKEQNDKLVFIDPALMDNQVIQTDRMRLSKPPGIENLGATCYLNTQLQCLARNLVFLRGIFSWVDTKKDSGDRMNSILVHFQRLLADMTAGPNCALNTVEFSDSLGLDHFEQQDPNEFSRLLLEKMHQSFQETAGTAAEANGNSRDLSKLLPDLFQGVIQYETSCMTCGTKSCRKEEFMDLNLPIVKPSEDQPRKKGQQSILSFLSPKQKLESDVQFCLDRYCHAEMLEGDNQYLCGQCGCKRDAKRELTFDKLPPVLNVQLCRYVYDRVKFQKKKLSDKVLLPLELRLGDNSGGRGAQSQSGEHRYVLCAVMRHKGTSAYSGHYVAEAMDWSTGLWYEFNDELVTLLPRGPSCSFDPSGPADRDEEKVGSKGKKKKPAAASGSQDAYNMYYVEETFLAQAIIDNLRVPSAVKSDKSQAGTSNGESARHIIDQTILKRTEFYGDLATLCLEDREATSRVDHRRQLIRKKGGLLENFSDITAGDAVWVNAHELRRFISCKDRLEDSLDSPSRETILQHFHLLCSHEKPGLHPRMARKGKLLSQRAYKSYVSALRKEKLAATRIDVPDGCLNDRIIQLGEIRCQECSVDYRSSLKKKLDIAKKLKYLWWILDKANNEESKAVEGQPLYVVSRKFVTALRTLVERLMKQAKTLDAVDDSDLDNIESTGEGLDALPVLESFSLGRHGLDKTVNGGLLCTHKNLKGRKTSIRCVSEAVWNTINELFPGATKLEFDSEEDISFDCFECHVDGQEEKNLLSMLSKFAIYCKDTKSAVPESEEKLLQLGCGSVSDQTQYRIVHTDELLAWERFLKAFRTAEPKSRSESVDEFVTKLMKPSISPPPAVRLPPNEVEDKEFVEDPVAVARVSLLLNMFRPVMCTKHQRPILRAVMNSTEDAHRNLSDNVAILAETSYQTLISQMSALATIMYDDRLDKDAASSVDEGAALCASLGIAELHPSVSPSVSGGTDSTCFVVSSDMASMKFQFAKPVCEDEECNAAFQKWQNEMDDMTKKDSKRSKDAPTRKPSTGSGSAAHDAINLDGSDLDDNQNPAGSVSLRVFQSKEGAEEESVLSSLATCAGVSDFPEAAANGVRRSTRSRKSRYPVGVILGEQSVPLALDNNIAAVRLALLERCEGFELSHSLKLVLSVGSATVGSTGNEPKSDKEEGCSSKSRTKVVVLDADESGSDDEDVASNIPNESSQTTVDRKAPARSGPIVVDLSFKLLDDTLRGVCETALGRELGDSFDPKQELLLVRQADREDVDLETGEQLEHLLSISNVAQEDSSGTAAKPGRKRKNRAAERGFSGTFLSSKSSSAVDEKDSAGDKATSGGDDDADEVVSTDAKPKAATRVDVDDTVQEQPRKMSKSGVLNPGSASKRSRVNEEKKEDSVIEVTNDPVTDSMVEIVAPKPSRKPLPKSVTELLEDPTDDEEEEKLFSGGLNSSPRPRKRPKSSKVAFQPLALTDAEDLSTWTKRALINDLTNALLENDLINDAAQVSARKRKDLVQQSAAFVIKHSPQETDYSKLMDPAIARFYELANMME